MMNSNAPGARCIRAMNNRTVDIEKNLESNPVFGPEAVKRMGGNPFIDNTAKAKKAKQIVNASPGDSSSECELEII